MTKHTIYTVLMKNAILSATPLWGAFWLLMLFIFSFALVHIARLARLGLRYREQQNKQNDAPTAENKTETTSQPKSNDKEKQAPTQTAQEPIYYIVERKAKDKNGRYGKPKQIHFK